MLALLGLVLLLWFVSGRWCDSFTWLMRKLFKDYPRW